MSSLRFYLGKWLYCQLRPVTFPNHARGNSCKQFDQRTLTTLGVVQLVFSLTC